MSYTIKNISSLLPSAAVSFFNENAEIQQLLTDSRRLNFPKTTLFFAIETKLRDGHNYVTELFNQGVRNFVVQKGKNISAQVSQSANLIYVNQPLDALQLLVAFHRSKFNIPVIGITGSNGKTIVKEWLNQLLVNDFDIVRTPRSYNSQIGVPLSVWEMSAENNLGIFEAGISLPGEMERLEKIIQPNIGIFTNIGNAHDEGFKNRAEKIAEKFKLFKNVQLLILPADNTEVLHLAEYLLSCKLFTWGKYDKANLQILDIEVKESQTSIKAKYKKESHQITIPFTDEASIQNALTCWATLICMDISADIIAERMQSLRPIDMRLEIKSALNNCTLINDSYSFDINSLGIALSFLQQQKIHKTVIISDLAYFDENLYRTIVNLLSQKDIYRVITIGPSWYKLQYLLHGKFEKINSLKSVEQFLANYQTFNLRDEAILLKGARKYAFEQIAKILENQVHQTRMEISIPALAHNLQEYRKYIQPETKIMAMVKASGYGSGSIEVATMAQFYHVNYLAVAYADEGVALRNSGISIPIAVMNFDEEAFETIVIHHLEPNIFSFKIYLAFHQYLVNQGIKNYPIHLKIDTGMHRLGFELEEMGKIVALLNEHNTMVVKSAFTHFVASEDPNEDAFTHQQANIFLAAIRILEDGIGYKFIRHIANSSAIIRFPQYHFDMVRLGIGLYGVDSSSLHQDTLETVATLISTIAQIHNVKAGETIGYNRRGKVDRDSKIATIRIGYADGLNRKLGNLNGSVFIQGKLAPLIGNICMDMAMVDITDIENVHEGDAVEIFGKNLPVWDVAKQIGTISYEVLTSVGQRIKRVYIEE